MPRRGPRRSPPRRRDLRRLPGGSRQRGTGPAFCSSRRSSASATSCGPRPTTWPPSATWCFAPTCSGGCNPGVALDHDEAALSEAFGSSSSTGTRSTTRPRSPTSAPPSPTCGPCPRSPARWRRWATASAARLAYVAAAYHDPDACVAYYGSGHRRPLGRADADHLPDAVPLRRQRPVHPERADRRHAGGVRRTGPTSRCTCTPAPATPSRTSSPPQFHNAAAAAASWALTSEFLARSIGN